MSAVERLMVGLAYDKLGDARCGSRSLRILTIGPPELAAAAEPHMSRADELLAIDTDAHRCERLRDHCDEVRLGEFLRSTPRKLVDVALLWPPMAEVAPYVAYAYHRWLNPGGALAALVPINFMTDLEADIPVSETKFVGGSGLGVLLAKKGGR